MVVSTKMINGEYERWNAIKMINKYNIDNVQFKMDVFVVIRYLDREEQSGVFQTYDEFENLGVFQTYDDAKLAIENFNFIVKGKLIVSNDYYKIVNARGKNIYVAQMDSTIYIYGTYRLKIQTISFGEIKSFDGMLLDEIKNSYDDENY